MKKITALVLTLCMLFSLVVCFNTVQNSVEESQAYFTEPVNMFTGVDKDPEAMTKGLAIYEFVKAGFDAVQNSAQRNTLSLEAQGANPDTPNCAEFKYDEAEGKMHGYIDIYYKNGYYYTSTTYDNNHLLSRVKIFDGGSNPEYSVNATPGQVNSLQEIFVAVESLNKLLVPYGVKIETVNFYMESVRIVAGNFLETISGADWAANGGTFADFVEYAPKMNYIRGDELGAEPLFRIATAQNYHVNFGAEVTIDNRVPYPDTTTPAIEVCSYMRYGINEGCLLLRGAKITNSLSGETKDKYAGIGVKLCRWVGETTGNGGALELWFNSVIEKCYIGSDQYVGCTRLKSPTSATETYTVADNHIAINLRRGTTIGKWTSDISMISASDVILTLESPEQWRDGDIIMTSGFEYHGTSTTPDQTPVIPDDVAEIYFANSSDMSQILCLSYSDNHPENQYYPVIQFADKVVYNTRTGGWYMTLYDALNAAPVSGKVGIQDGDTLVFYGYTKEQHTCVANYNLTIRAAVPGFDNAKEEFSVGCTATWISVDSGQDSCFVVPSGKTVKIGIDYDAIGNQTNNTDTKSVTLGFDGGKVARVIKASNSSYLTTGNFRIYNGKTSGNGGGLYSDYATVNLGALTVIENCTADNGGGLYVNYKDLYTATLSASGKSYATVIRNCSASRGGALCNYGGNVYFVGTQLSGNTASTAGNAVYQEGMFYLSGNASFGGGDVYLPTSNTADTSAVYVITDKGYTGSEVIGVYLGFNTNTNEYDGRNYVEGDVTAATLAKYKVLNLKERLECVYTADDALLHKPVLELKTIQNVSLVIKKNVNGECPDGQTFVFTVKGKAGTDAQNVNLTVVVHGTGTVTVNDIPRGEYTVTEDTSWSYNYSATNSSITQTVSADGTVFEFTNTAKPEKWLTWESEATNRWQAGKPTVVTRVK